MADKKIGNKETSFLYQFQPGRHHKFCMYVFSDAWQFDDKIQKYQLNNEKNCLVSFARNSPKTPSPPPPKKTKKILQTLLKKSS